MRMHAFPAQFPLVVQATPYQLQMRVVQAGNHSAASQVDQRCGGTAMVMADASGGVRTTAWKRPLSKIVLALMLALRNQVPDATSMNNQWPSLALNWRPIMIRL